MLKGSKVKPKKINEKKVQNKPARTTVVNFGVSGFHLNETEKMENPKADAKPNIKPVIVKKPELLLLNEKLADDLDLDFSNIGSNKLFYDVIYNPIETNFLKIGKENGNLSENGIFMFVYQALEAFKLWHGVEPKIDQEILKLLEND